MYRRAFQVPAVLAAERSLRPALLSLLVFAVAVEGGCASAPKTRSFAELHKYIDTGSTIRLVETTGTTRTGTLATLSPTSLTILDAGQSREVPESQVAMIRRPQRRPWQGALIGLGAGLVIGIATAPSDEPSTGSLVVVEAGVYNVMAGAVLGTALGAVVGALIKIDRTVYEAAPKDPPPERR